MSAIAFSWDLGSFHGKSGENVRLIYNLIHYTDKLNQKGITIFLDFKKAFDSIKWNYLLEALQLFNFGHDIQNWIKIFYNNVTSCVLNNGYASHFSPYSGESDMVVRCLACSSFLA